MSRVPASDRSPEDPFYSILGHRPEILEAWQHLDHVLLGDGSSTLPVALKEEVRRSLAQGIGCAFCASVGGDGRPSGGAVPDPKETLAVAIAEQIVENRGDIDDAMFGVLREEFDDRQIVELCAWVCFKFGANVLGSLMRLDPATAEQAEAYRKVLATLDAS
jgi:alkylhydroperoxidase family enzyme